MLLVLLLQILRRTIFHDTDGDDGFDDDHDVARGALSELGSHPASSQMDKIKTSEFLSWNVFICKIWKKPACSLAVMPVEATNVADANEYDNNNDDDDDDDDYDDDDGDDGGGARLTVEKMFRDSVLPEDGAISESIFIICDRTPSRISSWW